MRDIRIVHGEHCDWLHLELGKANAIGPDFLRAFDRALDLVAEDGQDGAARPVVVTGQGGAFSAGLDLPALVGSPRVELARFVAGLHRGFLRLACLPRPTLAAINGHAVAGGAVLALACDMRIAARTLPASDQPVRFGLNETGIGLPFPQSAQAIVEHALGGPAGASELMLTGELIDADAALRLGAVHAVAAAEDLVATVERAAVRYGAATARACAAVKATLTRDLRALAGVSVEDTTFLDMWYGEETQARLQAVVARLRAR